MKSLRFLLLTGFLAGSAAAQTVIQPLNEAASFDSKIYGSVPDGSFTSNLNVTSPDSGADFRSLVQFNLSSVALTGPQVTQAFLTLYCTGFGVSGVAGAGPGTVSISPILNAWRETETSPGTAPIGTWNNFFGASAPLNLGAPVASQLVSGVGFVTWDITPLVQSWLNNPTTNFGVMIQLASAGTDIGFADVDSAPGVAGSAPSLTVIPEPQTWVALSAGLVLLGLGQRLRRRSEA